MLLLVVLLALPLIASCESWYNFWYDTGVLGSYPANSYESFDLEAPRLNVLQWDERCDHGYILLTPRGHAVPAPGPLILDYTGELVWTEGRFGEVMDMKVQQYKGENYLTFWCGTDDGTHGRGIYYMLDSSYEVAYTVEVPGELDGDLHEFKLTDNGTALVTVYEIIPADLSPLGKSRDGWIYDGLFMEIDIETGDVIFEWRASSFYPVEETYAPIGDKGSRKDKAFDYFHINSVDKDPDGNYYISSRYMHTVTCISPSGDVLWVLGGKRSSFKDLSGGAASNFSWQHHVNWYPNNTLTIFDNGADDRSIITAEYSRGMIVSLDLDHMTATLVHEYRSPQGFISGSQGSVQIMPESGHVFVGWGHTSAYTEFTPDGQILCDVHFGPSMFFNFGWVKSYRAFKSPWVGMPNYPPDVEMDVDIGTAYVSWNGATEVAGWITQTAIYPHATEEEYDSIGYTTKESFETSIELPEDLDECYLRFAAVDIDGVILGYSRVIDTRTGQMASGTLLEPITQDIPSLQQSLLSVCLFAAILIMLWKARNRPPLSKMISCFQRSLARFDYQLLPQ
ncbi:hypothetical protein DTO212C5_501 [Paecilomyces variotii]|nr:hypothetical protein DTO212C5_501 [Paecilomyces variotii]